MWNRKLIEEIRELEELIAKANKKELIIELVKELASKEQKLKEEYVAQFKPEYQAQVEQDISAYKGIIAYYEYITEARRTSIFGNYLATDEAIYDKEGIEIEDGAIIKLDEPIVIGDVAYDRFIIRRTWDGLEWIYTAFCESDGKEYQFALSNLLRTDRDYDKRDYLVIGNSL